MIPQIQIAVKITLVSLFFTTPIFAQGFKKNQIIFYPCFNRPYNILTNLSDNGNEVDMSGSERFRNKKLKNWQNWHLGLGWTLYKPLSPFGASLDLLVVNRGYNIKTNVAGVETITNHRLLGFNPLLMFKLGTGDIEKMNHFFVNFGVSYNHYFDYKRSIGDNFVNGDTKNINQNSIMGVLGFGYELTPGKIAETTYTPNSTTATLTTPNSFLSVFLRYHHRFDNIFNTAYLENRIAPYKNWNTQLGYITFGITIRGQMRQHTVVH